MKHRKGHETAAEPEGTGVETPRGVVPEDNAGEIPGELRPVMEELDRLRAREDELLRAIAEQQNVVRRRRQEMDTSVRFAQESLVKDLLPVLDDLDRAVIAMEQSSGDSIRAGVGLIRDRLVRTLEQQGLTAIHPVGEPFDPELHDALAQRPSDEVAPGTVLEVAQPGYRFRDRVLRHAKVVVAGPAEGKSASRAGGGDGA